MGLSKQGVSKLLRITLSQIKAEIHAAQSEVSRLSRAISSRQQGSSTWNL
jgi:hypothetical protein